MSKKGGGGEKEQYYESFAFLSYTSTLTLFDCLGYDLGTCQTIYFFLL